MIRIQRNGSERAPSGALSPVRQAVASFSLLGAAAIHAAVIPHHMREWIGAGLFFVGLAATQGALGLIVGQRRSSGPHTMAVVVSIVAIALWAISRTAGLPIGPHAGLVEPIGFADVSATLLEGLTIAVVLSPSPARRTRAAAMGFGIVLSVAVAGALALRSPDALLGDPRPPKACPSQRSPASYLDHSHHGHRAGACRPPFDQRAGSTPEHASTN